MDLFVVQIQHECFQLDTNYSMWISMSRKDNSIEIPPYNKGIAMCVYNLKLSYAQILERKYLRD